MARKRTAKPRLSFFARFKDKFDYDVTALPAYIDDESPDIMADLINEGNLKSRISIMDNVKGTKTIKLKTSTPSLQGADACGWTPEGGIILTDKEIVTKRVKIQEDYCNEDLNDTWGQIENAAGANVQDTVAPNFADTMIMYYQVRATELDDNLMMNGDTGSGDSNLAHYDGFKKLWNNDPLLITSFTTQTAITAANGFDIFRAFEKDIPRVAKRHRGTIGLEIICGHESAKAVIDQIWDDKDFSAKLEFEEENGEISFMLPTTTTRVRSLVTLDGTDSVFAVPYVYMFWGTDLKNDQDGFTFNYDENDEKLRFSVKWRSGIQYVFPQYFTRLRLQPTS